MLFSSNPALVSLGNALTRYTSLSLDYPRYTGLIWSAAITMPFVLALINNATSILLIFILSLLILQCWQLVFKTSTQYFLPSAYTVVHAMLFSLLLPMDISLWSLVMLVSFGSVFGEQVFGGRGYSFLNPVTIGLAFYLFSDPIELSSVGASFIPVIFTSFIAVVLILIQLIAWRILLGILIGVIFTAWFIGMHNPQELFLNSGVLLALMFLASDPASGGSTNPSRWLHGILGGCLLLFLYSQSAAIMHATIFAVLLASLSAPLLDYLVVLVHSARRNRPI